MKHEEEKCCGNCAWFFGECTDGDGCCAKHYWDKPEEGQDPMLTRCDRKACEEYVSEEEKRHHLAVMLQFTRWMADESEPSRFFIAKNRKAVSWDELMEAIKFSIDYIKTFNKL